jgi:hypothetical protein
MAKEWQTKLEGWKVKTTPTHTVFFTYNMMLSNMVEPCH